MSRSTPTKEQPQGCTNLKLRQFMRRMGQHYDAEMSKIGLKSTQYSLLAYVGHFGPIMPAEVASGLKMDPSTLTRNLKPLVDSGWIVVSAGVSARSRLIALTDPGRSKLKESKRRWRAAQDGINSMLGSDNVVALHAMIDQSLESLDSATKSRKDGSEGQD